MLIFQQKFQRSSSFSPLIIISKIAFLIILRIWFPHSGPILKFIFCFMTEEKIMPMQKFYNKIITLSTIIVHQNGNICRCKTVEKGVDWELLCHLDSSKKSQVCWLNVLWRSLILYSGSFEILFRLIWNKYVSDK